MTDDLPNFDSTISSRTGQPVKIVDLFNDDEDDDEDDDDSDYSDWDDDDEILKSLENGDGNVYVGIDDDEVADLFADAMEHDMLLESICGYDSRACLSARWSPDEVHNVGEDALLEEPYAPELFTWKERRKHLLPRHQFSIPKAGKAYLDELLEYKNSNSTLREFLFEYEFLHTFAYEFRYDPEIFFPTTQLCDGFLMYGSDQVMDCKKFVLKMVELDYENYVYASNRLREDHEVAIRALSNPEHDVDWWRSEFVLTNLHIALRSNKRFIMEAFEHAGGDCLRYANETILDDEEVIVHGLLTGCVLWEVEAERCEPLRLASDRLRNTKSVVMVGVENWGGNALQFASPALKDDIEVVEAAVYGDFGGRGALKHASSNLQGRRPLVLKAVQSEGSALEYASPELRKDRDVVKAAISEDHHAIEHADSIFQSDLDIILCAELSKIKLPSTEILFDPNRTRSSLYPRLFQYVYSKKKYHNYESDYPHFREYGDRDFDYPNMITYHILRERFGDLIPRNDG